MGRSTAWLRRIFGGSKTGSSGGSDSKLSKEKKKWSFIKSSKDYDRRAPQLPPPCDTANAHFTEGPRSMYADAEDANKHAIAVAAATAAVAEAALAAAQAAAAVVRLTSGSGKCASTSSYVSSGGRPGRRREESAAVKIQSAFRAYLARRALKALKALVKLQALVRGHIVRKQTADMLRRMQALVRVQARARANRAHIPESSNATGRPLPHHIAPQSPKKNIHQFHANGTKLERSSMLKRCGSNSNIRDIVNQNKAHTGSNWLDQWIEDYSWSNHRENSLKTEYTEDERSDKILEVDTERPHLSSKGSNRTFQTSPHVFSSEYNSRGFMTLDSASKYHTRAEKPIPPSAEVISLSSLKFPTEVDEPILYTAENSPQMFSASSRLESCSRRGPLTPARSECSRNIFSSYPDHPNYMANTESSRAKVRSQSAPRQRIEYENPGSIKRSMHAVWDAGTNSHRGWPLHADLRNKDYALSDHLDRLLSSSLR